MARAEPASDGDGRLLERAATQPGTSPQERPGGRTRSPAGRYGRRYGRRYSRRWLSYHCGRGEDAGGGVRPGDDGDLEVLLLQRLVRHLGHGPLPVSSESGTSSLTSSSSVLLLLRFFFFFFAPISV